MGDEWQWSVLTLTLTSANCVHCGRLRVDSSVAVCGGVLLRRPAKRLHLYHLVAVRVE